MFAAVFSVDGRPVDSRPFGAAGYDFEILDRAGHVAFACSKAARASATGEASGIRGLDGRYWIVGRVRLDARDELRSRLLNPSLGATGGIPDAELCMHAYAAWGDGFLDRLAGDFCFVLWDDARKRLICARDQLGVRSLFHAEAVGTWFVSDSLDWIAAQAPVARDLDDTWIADFLTVGHSLEVERTVRRHVRRLAPAHVLTISASGVTMRRYWRLDIGDPLYFRERRQYAECFLDLLSKSIVDRLPAGKVGIPMSGGLDSTTLAARAVDATGDASRVVAECIHFKHLPSDREKHFSSLVAQRLGIELLHRPGDDFTYDPQWRARSIATSEPSALITTAHFQREIACERAERAPVWLCGEGPDNALAFERNEYLSWLVGRQDWRRLAEAGMFYLKVKGLAGWWETLARYAGRRHSPDDSTGMPPWLAPSLVSRLGLNDRLGGMAHQGGIEGGSVLRHPWHPGAVAGLNDPIWPAVFADYELEESLGPLVLRHPFLDLRVLEFMLSVPTLPWAREKLLLREAMRGRLPDEVITRKKAPLPNAGQMPSPPAHDLPALSRNSRLDRYVDVRILPSASLFGRPRRNALAVHVLDHWLTQSGA